MAPLLITVGLSASMSPAQSAVGYSGYTDWKAISAGASSTCAIRTTGQLYCWSTDGTGSAIYALSGARDWTSVSVGATHTCATRGKLYCWGNDTDGQLGNGAGGSTNVPTQITTATDWKTVSAGATHTCATRGKLYCWGNDTDGQLGNGTGSPTTVPTQITTATDWKTVSAGATHTCATRGKLYCWGNDTDGQLGNGTGGPTTTVVQITTATDWKTVSAGTSHTCAIRGTSNTLYCWGSNTSRQTADSGTASSYPSPLRFSTHSWRAIAAGAGHTCAILVSPARIYCWGAQRQPSNGTPAGTALPANVLDLRRWKLTIPADGSDAGTTADEVKWPPLGTYRSLSFFHTTSDNTAVVFRTPVGGAKTGGSVFARTELRERTFGTTADETNCDWSNQTGTHRMTITQKVTHLPSRIPRVVVGQIHDPSDEVVMIRVDGSNIIAEASYPDPAYPDGRKVQEPLKAGYTLGTYFTVRIQASSAGVAVYYNEGKSDARTVGFPDRVSRGVSTDGWYFKAGHYLQTNTAKGESPNEYGEAVISSLTISHPSGVCD